MGERSSSDSLTAQTLRGTKWTYLSTFVNIGLQLVISAVLARLLAPSSFGLIAMAWLVLRFGQYFAQMGVGQALVQRKEVSKANIAAGFWASVAIGLAFSAAAWLAAPLASRAFAAPQLGPVLSVMGLSFFLTGTSTTAFALLRRRMRFRGIAIADISAYVVGYGGVGVAMAAAGLGVWSLVGASLAQTLVASIAYNALARPRVVPVFTWQPYRELLGFGSMVSVISFLEFIDANLDTITVGRMAGSSALGYYSRALSLTSLPMQYLSTSLSRVLFPSFSRIHAESERIRRAYLSIITVFAGVGLPIAFGMSGAASDIVAVLLGPHWAPSVPVMRLTAIGSAAAMLSHFAGVTLEASARLKEKLIVRACQLVWFATLLLGLGRFGLTGYALAFGLSELSLHLALTWRLAVDFAMPRREVTAAYTPGLIGGAVSCVTLYGESLLARSFGLPSAAALAIEVATGAVILAATVLLVGRGRVFRVLALRTRGEVHSPIAGRLLKWGTGIVDWRERRIEAGS
jgi:lipopolysaccharide exporter